MRLQSISIPLIFSRVVYGQSSFTWWDSSAEDPTAAQAVMISPQLHSKYQFPSEIKHVGIIGAGVSGLVAARELLASNFSVRMFERDDVPGGVWHYSDEAPLPATYHHVPAQFGDYVPSLPPSGSHFPYEEVDDGSKVSYEEKWREHRAPKQVWKNLHSNAAAPSQQITEWPWPQGTPWELPQWRLSNYLRSFASYHGLNSNDDNDAASYRTRVELAEKVGQKWVLTLKSITPHGLKGTYTRWWKEEFDALVVATGRYNSPKIPAISGLPQLAQKWPNSVHHSREYRKPEAFDNKTVLIVGVSISASEIARDIAPHISKLYQSVREKQGSNDTNTFPAFDRKFQLSRLPKESIVVPEIDRFELPATNSIADARIVLKNGTVLTGIDEIILATGFLYSYPFLPNLHNDTLGLSDAPVEIPPLVTDGTHVRSLHLDLFYIPDPTLAFIGVPRLVGDFTYAEYLALAAAKVWSKTADLPSEEQLWESYKKRVEERGGYSTTFQFLSTKYAPAAYKYFVGWLNSAAVKYGGRQVEGLPAYRDEVVRYWGAARFGTPGVAEATGFAVDEAAAALDW